MKLCNETITILNKRLDDDTGYDIYVPTVITGVSWFCEIRSNVDSTGLQAANLFTIRIPEDADFSGKAYVEPAAYAGGDPTKVFTIDNGDIIVKAAVSVPDPEPGENSSGSGQESNTSGSEQEGTSFSLKPADLQALYGQVVTVLGVTDNRRTARAPHWKVVGK